MGLKPINRGLITTLRLLVLLGLGFCCSSTDAVSQTAHGSGDVTLTRGSAQLKEIFRAIGEQSGYKFAYTASNLDTERSIELTKETYALEELLDLIFVGTDCRYEIHDRHIIILDVQENQIQQSLAAGTPSGVSAEGTKPQANGGRSRSPIKIDDRELKRFTSDDARHDGTREHYTSQSSYNMHIRDAEFPVPGKLNMSGRIPDQFKTHSPAGLPSVALKINLLYGAATFTPNIRVEAGLAGNRTLDLAASYNGWNWKGDDQENRKFVHAHLLAEYRHWFCERFNGHFVGVHAFYTHYNISAYNVPLLFDKDYRYQGTIWGAGLSYGYSMPIAARWNVEFNIGLGVGFLNDDVWGCNKCDYLDHTRSKIYFGPTRAGITIAYMLR